MQGGRREWRVGEGSKVEGRGVDGLRKGTEARMEDGGLMDRWNMGIDGSMDGWRRATVEGQKWDHRTIGRWDHGTEQGLSHRSRLPHFVGTQLFPTSSRTSSK